MKYKQSAFSEILINYRTRKENLGFWVVHVSQAKGEHHNVTFEVPVFVFLKFQKLLLQ
jgi:hypothetical protein